MADDGGNGAPVETQTTVVEPPQRAVTPKKLRKRNKSESSDGQSNGAAASSCTGTASNDGDGKEKQEANKRERIVWTPKLHAMFVKACNELGIEDAVPMKILQRMKTTGITRAQIASHLQKYRENLSKQKDEAIISESSVIALHHMPPPAVPPSLQSPLETPGMCSQPQLGHAQPLQKPPNDHISNHAIEQSLFYQELHLLLVPPQVEQGFAPPLHQVTRRELIMEEQPAAMMQQHAAAASSQHSPMPVGVEQATGAPVPASGKQNHRPEPHVQPSQAVNTLEGECSVPEDNMILHEESAQLQVGAQAEKGQGRATEFIPHVNIIGQYWRSDCESSWDLFG